MKNRATAIKLGLGALALSASVATHGAQFFRIAGPVATTITALSADGHITWTNSPTNATFTVQTAHSLPGQTNWVDYVQVPATSGVTAQRLYDPNPPSGMALIPAGSFTMGDCMGDGYSFELPLHTVYESAFYMDRYDVTKSLWATVYQWAIAHGYTFDNVGAGAASTHPVQAIDWYDCVKWCNARSEKEGRVPAYYTDAGLSVRYRTGQVDVQTNWVNWSSGYRLPTEAEWEKAARGGASGQRFPWGNTISWSQANYYAYPSGYPYDVNPTSGYHPTFNSYTSPVGYFAANGYGLYDMAGNVWQWCWDWYGPYSSGSQTDPRGPTSGSYRVLQGGSWYSHADNCRTAHRDCSDPTYRYITMGFRSVLPSGQ
jgi:sulfatase modifying factor 1